MKFGIYAAIVSLVSAQEILVPVTDEINDTGCAFTFKECENALGTWKLDPSKTTCDHNPAKVMERVHFTLVGEATADIDAV